MKPTITAVLSDIHGNDFALLRCLEDAEQQATAQGAELRVWCLGDLANGPPGSHASLQMFEALGERLEEWLLGNHDLAQLLWWPEIGAAHLPIEAGGRERVRREAMAFVKVESWLNLLADDVPWLESVRLFSPRLWQRWVLSPSWALSRALRGVFLAHGLVAEPNMRHPSNTVRGLFETALEDHLSRAARLLREYSSEPPRLLLTGHTHVPAAWQEEAEGSWQERSVGVGPEVRFPVVEQGEPMWVEMEEGSLWVLNVGSVGHQRTQQPELADSAVYLLLKQDDEHRLQVAYRRVRYDLAAALQEFEQRGCPRWLREQLQQGY